MGIPNIKSAVESLYTGTANVYDFAYVDTGHGAKKLSDEPTLIHEGISCRLSHKTLSPNEQDRYGTIEQETVMYCDPTLAINPGAKITITQAGATTTYECAGLRAMYESHQEIRLKVFRGRA